MSNTDLGRLERVDLRSVWISESGDFTPWLATEDNLELLGETIGIELEFESRETGVGPFRADILCKDTSDGSWVLIENQLERTDHCHLGQLMTYAAGLQAATIVWIANRFTEEHRAALDWLNEITGEKFNFFGLEVELWRIGSSPVAPKFNVVCKPNDWSKTVSETAKRAASDELTGTQQLQLEYWSALREHMERTGTQLRGNKPAPQSWINFALGRTNFWIGAAVNTQKDWIAVAMSCSGTQSKQFFALLEADKTAIEIEMGEPLLWEPLPNRKESRIRLMLNGADCSNRADWPRQHEWMRSRLEKLHKVFSARVKKLKVIDVAAAGPVNGVIDEQRTGPLDD
jgi:hypothetical protein